MTDSCRRRRPSERAFTLIELMIVVAIIGILAAIAIPKFAALIRKSSEGASKGNLGSIRSALSIYYGDMEGQYPSDALASLTQNSKYLSAIPNAKTPSYHADTSTVYNYVLPTINDNGGWAFDNTTTDPNLGYAWVNCVHTDTKGSYWSNY